MSRRICLIRKEKMERRSFIKTAAAFGALAVSPRIVMGGAKYISPNEKLNIAAIGLGQQGSRDIRNLETENIVALCDVDYKNAAETFNRHPNAAKYKDYREMLDKQKDIDAVMIATPDHTHAIISVAAMQAGKHVYCQKPLTHSIYEARRVAQVAKETGVVTQMGIQNHSAEHVRLLVEWVKAGAIGEVSEVEAWSTLSFYPYGHEWWSPSQGTRPTKAQPVPKDLDWNLWIGPAPMRPYHRVYHPCTWRAWWDFGCGMMGDRGVHTLDSIVWALDLGLPESIEATSLGMNNETHPLSAIITFRFPARGNLPPVKLTWYEGMRPSAPPELENGRRFGGSEGGIFLRGSKGLLMADYTAQSPRLIPEISMQKFVKNRLSSTIPRVPGGHFQQWVQACKGRCKAEADFAYGSLLTEICHLGNIAKRVDSRILWDAQNMRVTNNESANQYVRREYRQGWTI